MAVASQKYRMLFSILLLLGIALLFFRGLSIYQRGYGKSFGWTATLFTDQKILSVDVESPAYAAGLRTGDRILAFNALSGFEGEYQRERLIRAFRTIDVDAEYWLRIDRDGRPLELKISSEYRGKASLRFNLIQYHLIGLVYLSFGLVLLLLKPYHRLSILFSVFLMGLSVCYIPVQSSRLPLAVGIVVDLIQYSAILIAPYLLVHFFLLFPHCAIEARRYKLILGLLYSTFSLQAVSYLIPKLADLYSATLYNRVPVFNQLAVFSFNGFYFAFLAAIAIGFLILARRFFQAERQADKRKYLWVLSGMLTGLPPLIILNGLAQFRGIKVPHWAAMIAGLISLAFPCAIGYAIVKHRVMDVRFVVRQSVKYFLSSRLLQIMQTAILIILLLYLLPPVLSYIEADLSVNIIAINVAVVYSLIFWLTGIANRRIHHFLNQRFFQGQYNTAAILYQITQSLAEIKEQERLLMFIAEQLFTTMNLRRIAYFLPEQAEPSILSGKGATAEKSKSFILSCWSLNHPKMTLENELERWGEIDNGCAFLTRCTNDGSIKIIEEENRDGWLQQFPDMERVMLEDFEIALVIPLTLNGTLSGLIGVGEKLSELPFTPEDLQLLSSIAVQFTIALEKIWLLQEVSRQVRLKRELEIAQMVQGKLFPTAPAHLKGIEVVGKCFPARTVGGDYFDFIEKDRNRLGIAIGDASGKGISGALMMSSLHASLRTLTENGEYPVTEVVGSVNNLLCRSISSDKFVTFFYSVFDEATKSITYVNAGHEPPLIIRSVPQVSAVDIEAGEVLYASTGGMVLGVAQDYTYEEDTIPLSTGDVFIAYTDGVTEARNEGNEEYGVKRLENLIQLNSHLPANSLGDILINDLYGFIGKREQMDDITFVIAKIA